MQIAKPMDDLWVFGYGSLMWRPGFAFLDARRARIPGFGRSFCIYSVHHRGTEERPGLVLGLDRGGVCEGMAFRVAVRDVEATLDYLREREQVNGVYREARVAIALMDEDACAHHSRDAPNEPRQTVSALTYLAERAHPSYAGHLPLVLQARIVRAARGNSGNNIDYVANTLVHLRELGIRDWGIERLAVVAGARTHGACGGSGSLNRDDVPCPRAAAMSRRGGSHPVTMPKLRPLDRRRFAHRKALRVL